MRTQVNTKYDLPFGNWVEFKARIPMSLIWEVEGKDFAAIPRAEQITYNAKFIDKWSYPVDFTNVVAYDELDIEEFLALSPATTDYIQKKIVAGQGQAGGGDNPKP